MVQALRLKVGQVELVRDQAHRYVPRESGMSVDGGQLAGTPAFVGGPVTVADAQGEMGVVVEEKGRHMVVVDEEQHVRPLLREPPLHGLVACEYRCPDRILLLLRVERETDRRGV